MKVALIADGFSVEKGTGIARYSYELYKGLKDRGIDVEPIMVGTHDIPFGQAISHVFRLPYRVLRRMDDFDIMHATSPITGLCFPFIRKPKVMTYHDIISMIHKDSGNSLHARLAAPLFFRVGKWSDRIITISSQTKEEIVEHIGIPEETIDIINIGANIELRPIENEEKDCFVIGYLGTFTLRKKVDYLVRAFGYLKKAHPDIKVKLALCGKKTLEYDNLVDLVNELGLDDSVEFRDFIPQERLRTTYNSFDVFAITSEWEGFGIPIIEAQRCGVPVIIRKDARIPEEVSRFCLKADSEKDMADKVFKLLTTSSMREGMIKNSINYCREFTWEQAVEKTIKVYEDVMSKKS